MPSTLAEDGDPLDAMILCDAPTYPGVVVACRPIGVVKASQLAAGGRSRKKRVRNDRVICVAVDDARREHLLDAAALPDRVRAEIAAFFFAVVAFEGKDVEILGWGDARAARRAIDRARAAVER